MKLAPLSKVNWGFFLKLLISLLAVMLIPTIAISAVNYSITTNNLEREVSQSNLDTLLQTKEAFDNVLNGTESAAYQLIRNQDIHRILNAEVDASTYADSQLIGRALNTMEMLSEGTLHIRNIYVYSSYNRLLMTSQTGIYQKLSDVEIANFQRYAERRTDSVWLKPGEAGIFGETSSSIQLIKFLYGLSGEIRGFIAIDLKDEELLRLINKIYIRKSGFLSIISAEGDIIVNRGPSLPDLLPNLLRSDWLQHSEGYRKIDDTQGRQHLVSFTSSAIGNWRYIAVVPTEELDGKAGVIGKNILLVSLFFAAAATVLAITMAKGIYNPVAAIGSLLAAGRMNERDARKLSRRKDELGQIGTGIRQMIEQLSSEREIRGKVEGEMSLLRERFEKSRPELKNYLLYRLMIGDAADEEDVLKEAELYQFDPDGLYLVLLADVAGLVRSAEGADERNESARQRLQQAVAEGLCKLGEANVFFEQKDRLIGIVAVDETIAEGQEAVRRLCQALCESVRTRFGLSLTVAGGDVHRGLLQLNVSYTEAEQAMRYKFVLGLDAVILYGDVGRQAATGAGAVKTDYIKLFRNCLEAKNAEQAVRTVRQLQEDIKRRMEPASGYAFYYRSMITALIQLLYAEHRIHSMLADELNAAFIRFEEQFTHIDSASEWLIGKIRESLESLGREQQVHRTVMQAMELIRNHKDHDVSLTELAEQMGVNSSYLSRLFKEQTGKTFKEYVTELKIAKARRLLTETDWSVERIAREAGYNHTLQFSRMFRKQENMSALEYREAHKN